MKRFMFALLFSSMAFFAMAQDVGYSIKINVEAIFHGERLALHEKYQTGGNIEELKFFLSAFQLMKDGKQVWAERGKHFCNVLREFIKGRFLIVPTDRFNLPEMLKMHAFYS